MSVWFEFKCEFLGVFVEFGLKFSPKKTFFVALKRLFAVFERLIVFSFCKFKRASIAKICAFVAKIELNLWRKKGDELKMMMI